MIPNTSDRVPAHTADEVNAHIAKETNERFRHFARSPAGIDGRLRDIERALEANAATAALVGIVLAATVNKRWLMLPALVGGFLLQHSIQGWCPPLPILRRLGFRTSREIDEERVALKALRGDFGPIGPSSNERDDRAAHALQAARL